MTEKEIWKAIPGFPGYEVSDFGNVRSWYNPGNHSAKFADTPKEMKQFFTGPVGKEYLSINLYRNRKHKTKRVHCLVLEAFIGPRPPNKVACHGDGDKNNNRLSNLRWDTRAANEQDKMAHGRSTIGERNGMSKLTSEQVLDIRRLDAMGESNTIIARRYRVRKTTISRIVSRKRWKHLA